MMMAWRVIEIAAKNERKGFVLKNGEGLFKVGLLFWDAGGESVESVADLRNRPVDCSGAKWSGGVDLGSENAAVGERFLGNGFGFSQGPSGDNGGAAVFEKIEVGELIVRFVSGGIGSPFVFLKENEVDFLGLNVVDEGGDFTSCKENVACEHSDVGFSLRLGDSEVVGIDDGNGEGDKSEDSEVKFGVAPAKHFDDGNHSDRGKGERQELRWGVAEKGVVEGSGWRPGGGNDDRHVDEDDGEQGWLGLTFFAAGFWLLNHESFCLFEVWGSVSV